MYPSEKRCPKCGEVKSSKEFPKSIRHDGKKILYSYCKSCHRAKQTDYQKTEKGKLVHKKAAALWEKMNREKKSAHNATKRALAKGKIKKEPCILCGELNSQAHHPDYTKLLGVIWLCPKHHAEVHAGVITMLDIHDAVGDCHHSSQGEDGCDCDLLREKLELEAWKDKL